MLTPYNMTSALILKLRKLSGYMGPQGNTIQTKQKPRRGLLNESLDIDPI